MFISPFIYNYTVFSLLRLVLCQCTNLLYIYLLMHLTTCVYFITVSLVLMSPVNVISGFIWRYPFFTQFSFMLQCVFITI